MHSSKKLLTSTTTLHEEAMNEIKKEKRRNFIKQKISQALCI